MTERVVRGADDAEVARLVVPEVTRLLAAAPAGRPAGLVLTGGTLTRTVHPLLAEEPVDWNRVELWWGDDRYVPAADEERNAGQARQDLLSRVPLPPEKVHEMPASDAGHPDVTAAAASYDAELRAVVDALADDEPWFEVLMLGIGPDGHCASLFPGRPEVHSPAYVLPVTDSPKPPPTRISLGMTALGRARHVLFVVAGEGKAEAVARSVGGAPVDTTPSAGPRGLESTTWFVDEAAARLLR
ncbi:6-phosphogluconolactonase [Nocardioides caldifontis]|uniref:6-phosphogluconolactonase n=1 Tax=Nocardioides caldifontis TaxID=2588938 RepID=UPI0011E023AE|nr:6-phosphogluconolactonase [Nocardioides caldifontis]